MKNGVVTDVTYVSDDGTWDRELEKDEWFVEYSDNSIKTRVIKTLDFIRNKYFISGYKSRVNEKMGKQPIPVTHGILQGTLAFLLEQINQSWGQIFIRIDSHNKLLILRRLSVLYFE